jgi:hypothetical protein
MSHSKAQLRWRQRHTYMSNQKNSENMYTEKNFGNIRDFYVLYTWVFALKGKYHKKYVSDKHTGKQNGPKLSYSRRADIYHERIS